MCATWHGAKQVAFGDDRKRSKSNGNGKKHKRIPCGNDNQKTKTNDNGKSGFPA